MAGDPGPVSVTLFLEAAGLALLPTLAWGWFFVSRNPESLRLVVVTFVLGTLAIVPLLLFMDELGVRLAHHEAVVGRLADEPVGAQVLGTLVFFAAFALVLFGVSRLFHYISSRITRHVLRVIALCLAALLLAMTSLSYEQLRLHFGPVAGALIDLFHFLVVFALALFLLERVSRRRALNVALAGLAALLAVVAIGADARLGGGVAPELSSISALFSLPFLVEVADAAPLTLKILNFLQVYLLFAVIGVTALMVIAMVHVVYLLHESVWLKALHLASLLGFSMPFIARAIGTVAPDFPFVGFVAAAPQALEAAWFTNLALLAGLSAWAVRRFLRQAGPRGARLLAGVYEEPINFVGVGVFMTSFMAVFHFFGLPVAAFAIVFLAFGEEYTKHLVVRFTDDDSIRSIDDAIEFSIIVGLAFAFAENVLLYFPRYLADGDTATLVMRSVLTVLMHAVSSGICGYFYGLSFFSTARVRSGHAARGRLYHLLNRLFLLKRQAVYHEVKLFQGIVCAGAFHAVFNLAASQGRIGIMVGLVAVGSALLYFLLGQKANQAKRGGIGPRYLPTPIARLGLGGGPAGTTGS